MTSPGDARPLVARLYGFLYRYRETYASRFEASVLVLEIGLISVGLGLSIVNWIGAEAAEHHGSGHTLEVMHDFFEVPVFVVLLLLAVSRVIVKLRTLKLGYSYAEAVALLKDSTAASNRRFHDLIRAKPIGRTPASDADWPVQIPEHASRIARQTASLLSIRSWLLRDEQWRSREQDALVDWFGIFPHSLWLVPQPPAASDVAASHSSDAGYFSVIVPMTPQSMRSLRQGRRATDMAEIHQPTIRTFRLDRKPTDPMVPRADLLAYLHIHVPRGDEARDDTMLIAASFQHLAYLLLGLFGAEGDFTGRWHFTVLCESSNDRMNVVLRGVGFVPVERERDGSETEAREARSYAGFLLFELVVEAGVGRGGEATAFLGLLRHFVEQHATRPALTDA